MLRVFGTSTEYVSHCKVGPPRALGCPAVLCHHRCVSAPCPAACFALHMACCTALPERAANMRLAE